MNEWVHEKRQYTVFTNNIAVSKLWSCKDENEQRLKGKLSRKKDKVRENMSCEQCI